MNKLKHILLCLFLLTASCAHKYSALFSETMLPDGKTWDVKARVDCSNVNLSVEKCKEHLRDTITTYGTELCGQTPERVFTCAVKGNADYTASGSCYVKCSDK